MNWSGVFPVEAATNAAHTDHIFFGLLAISGAVIALVLALIIGFSVRYRKGSKANRADMPEVMSREFEIGWTVATLFVFAVRLLVGGLGAAAAFLTRRRRHGDPRRRQAVDVEGAASRTACARSTRCTCPSGVPVRLVMTSQDVIHSFYVPAFRIKQDVLPGRYTADLVQGDQARRLPPVLRRILRHRPLRACSARSP